MRTRTLVTLLAAAAILCFMTPMTQAQTATTGQIVGVVADPTGAVVAGANVTLTSDAGVRRQTDNRQATAVTRFPCSTQAPIRSK